jgi:hypothetical protein
MPKQLIRRGRAPSHPGRGYLAPECGWAAELMEPMEWDRSSERGYQGPVLVSAVAAGERLARSAPAVGR